MQRIVTALEGPVARGDVRAGSRGPSHLPGAACSVPWQDDIWILVTDGTLLKHFFFVFTTFSPKWVSNKPASFPLNSLDYTQTALSTAAKSLSLAVDHCLFAGHVPPPKSENHTRALRLSHTHSHSSAPFRSVATRKLSVSLELFGVQL